MRAARRFLGDRCGASAVEFSLVVVPLLLFIFGTIEFSRLMWCMGIVQPSCSSGTAYNEANTKSYIIARASSFGVPLTAGNITLNDNTACNGVSGFSTVTINYTFSSLAPKLITALTSSRNLTTSACFPNQI